MVGAYGVVCSAVNKKTRQKVAIKKIPNLFTMDPRYAIRTYREIKILQVSIYLLSTSPIFFY